MIIDGIKISEKMYDELKREVSQLDGEKPTLGAILVGDDSASLKYIAQKRKWAEFVGMGFELKQFDKEVGEEELLSFIESWNIDENISGYIIQLPVPKHIDATKMLRSIFSEKDVDGFHPINQGKVLIGDETGFAPCTPYGVMGMFKELNMDLAGKKVVVIGRSNIVGKPLAAMCINAGATVTSCNSQTPDISEFTKAADIVICAAGVPGLLALKDINDSTVVIDVGFTIKDGKIYGDAQFEEIQQNGNLITPVPGGVGRLTVAQLLTNTFKAHSLGNTHN